MATMTFVTRSGLFPLRLTVRQFLRGRMPRYRILDEDRRSVDVHSIPRGRGGTSSDRRVEFSTEDVEHPVVIDGHDLGSVPVKDVLP